MSSDVGVSKFVNFLSSDLLLFFLDKRSRASFFDLIIGSLIHSKSGSENFFNLLFMLGDLLSSSSGSEYSSFGVWVEEDG